METQPTCKPRELGMKSFHTLCEFTPRTPGSHCIVFTPHTVYTLLTLRELREEHISPRYNVALFEHEQGKRFPHFKCSIVLSNHYATLTRAAYFDSATGQHIASAILDPAHVRKVEELVKLIAQGSDMELYRLTYRADTDEVHIRVDSDVIRIAENHIERVRGGM